MSTENESKNTPTLRQVLSSVLAAGLGVQSERNRERDFTHGRPSHYIVIGLIMTFVFVLTIWGLVKLVLMLSTG
jgi:hypothetical protein